MDTIGWVLLALVLLGGLFLVFAYVNPLGQGARYRPAAPEYDRLRSTQVRIDENGKKVFGEARAEKRGGLNVAWLKGSPYAMGYQHGKLLREEVQAGALLYHAGPVDNLPPFNTLPAWQRWLLARFFNWTVFRSLRDHAPRAFLEEVKGLADGAGLPFDVTLRGNLLSEFNMVTAKILRRMMLRRLGAANECSSFAAYGSMTRDGSLVVGRNTDYHGAGLWDVTQVVFFYQPDQGYRYANVGSAGLIKCNSCLNEHALCLGGHFMYSADVKAQGVGFTAFEHEIMRRAASIDEAYRIVRENPRAGAFAYLLADGIRQQAAVLEATTGAIGLRQAEGDAAWETNFMTCEETSGTDMLLELGIARNPVSRYKRLEELIGENAGSITPQAAAHIIGDHKDMASGDVRPFGNVIATLGNLTSVVFKPADFIFWVADGPAPVCNNAFIGFHFMNELEHTPCIVTPPVLDANPYVKTAGFEALRHYYPIRVRASLPPFERTDLVKCVQETVELVPGEISYRLLLAKLLMRIGQVDDAAEQFHMLVDYSLSPSEQAQVMLFLGFTYDLNGERDHARRCYTDILYKTQSPQQDHLNSINPFILADARRHLRTPFSTADLRTVEASLDMGSIYDR